MLPYGRQSIDDDDVRTVVNALRSDFLTTGPGVERFENALARYVSCEFAVAVSSGTAALHTAMFVLGIQPDDEVIVPTMTFVATANAVVYMSGKPTFVDVDPDTLLIDPLAVEAAVTERTRAIAAVDYAGQPCDHEALRAIAEKHGIALLSDSSHSLGSLLRGKPVATFVDVSTYSFHPVKHITTGEGGALVTNSSEYASRARRFRNHGLDTDYRERALKTTWDYAMIDLGFNYRLTDFQSALGLSQLRKLPAWIERRRALAERYDSGLQSIAEVRPLSVKPTVLHAYHLYPVLITRESGINRDRLFAEMRKRGIGVNVHYRPVHTHPFYVERFGNQVGSCPHAEEAGSRLLTLPLFPEMSDGDLDRVLDVLQISIKQCLS